MAISPAAGAAWRRRYRPATARSPRRVGPVLAAEGMLLVGLDVIGDYLTEINVTSPAGMREIMDQTGLQRGRA